VNLLTDGSEKNPLLGFCLAVISRHAENWPPPEEVFAGEFVDWLGFSSFLTRDALRELCLSKGVNLSFTSLPPELRGFNCSFHNKREIVVSEDLTALSADIHTLLHEFREMLEHVFAELGHATVGPENSLEVQAEHFAVSARIKAAERELSVVFEKATKIEGKWARYFSYGLLAIFGIGYLVSCILLPHYEDMASEARR
jgi:hypothetical protein